MAPPPISTPLLIGMICFTPWDENKTPLFRLSNENKNVERLQLRYSTDKNKKIRPILQTVIKDQIQDISPQTNPQDKPKKPLFNLSCMGKKPKNTPFSN